MFNEKKNDHFYTVIYDYVEILNIDNASYLESKFMWNFLIWRKWAYVFSIYFKKWVQDLEYFKNILSEIWGLINNKWNSVENKIIKK